MNESDLEEIEQQLTGQNTVNQLAEFKARALGDMVIAKKIKDNQMTQE